MHARLLLVVCAALLAGCGSGCVSGSPVSAFAALPLPAEADEAAVRAALGEAGFSFEDVPQVVDEPLAVARLDEGAAVVAHPLRGDAPWGVEELGLGFLAREVRVRSDDEARAALAIVVAPVAHALERATGRALRASYHGDACGAEASEA